MMFLENGTPTVIRPNDVIEWDPKSHSVGFWRVSFEGLAPLFVDEKLEQRYCAPFVRNAATFAHVAQLIAATSHLTLGNTKLKHTFQFRSLPASSV